MPFMLAPMKRRTTRHVAAMVAAAGTLAALGTARPATASTGAYIINVTVKPYNFPNGDAFGYGYGLCDRVRQGLTYPQMVGGVKADFNNDDEWAAVYLINQAIGELCPDQIWQLRNVAIGYRGNTPPTPFPPAA